MVKVYFHEIKSIWDEAKAQSQLALLPEEQQTKIAPYKSAKERQSRIIGKLMLLQLIKDFDLDLSLIDLKYSSQNKPSLSPDFDFSIAHSGDMVICAAALHHKIGIDIEQLKLLDISDYKEHLTENEWALVNKSDNNLKGFYEIWTKKEALLKASGVGMDIELNTVDVCENELRFEGTTYYFYPITISENTIAHIASTEKNMEIELRAFSSL